MEKTVKLGGKELRLSSSLYSFIEYRNTFGVDIFDDFNSLNDDLKGKMSTKAIETMFRFIYAFNKQFSDQSFDKFLMGFDFSVLTKEDEIKTLFETIGEMLGSLKDKSPEDHKSPQQ